MKINWKSLCFVGVISLFSFRTIGAFEFPKDHTFHNDYSLEWCYFIGNLVSDKGNELGYELSFFHAKLNGKIEVFPVHFAISDIGNKKHYTAQTIERNLGNLAVYNKNLIRSGDYKVEILGEAKFRITANPRNEIISLELDLTSNKNEILFHGDNGYSIKSNIDKNFYSYYYSIPRLETKGFLQIGKERFKISSGTSWMDHEWSFPDSKVQKEGELKKSLASKENSWDWICLNLDDGSDLMLFNFRKDKSKSSETFGTLKTANGEIISFKGLNEISLNPLGDIWKSPTTKAKYPMRWKIQSNELKLEIEALFPEQEFIGFYTTGNSYWEGAVNAKGIYNEKPIKGKGYLELKGY